MVHSISLDTEHPRCMTLRMSMQSQDKYESDMLLPAPKNRLSKIFYRKRRFIHHFKFAERLRHSMSEDILSCTLKLLQLKTDRILVA